jgi:sn-1 stearoyl-lipid 9-desaturase
MRHHDPEPHATPLPCQPHELVWSAPRSLFLTINMIIAAWWGVDTASWGALAALIGLSLATLCLGHSVAMHRGLIHQSFTSPRWLMRAMVYLGTLTGIGGPIALVRMHELRDYWQNKLAAPSYYTYAHGLVRDYLWYLHIDYRPADPEHAYDPPIFPRVKDDPFYQWLQRTWMLQQLPLALLLYLVGGWGFVVWGVCGRVSISIVGHWLVNFIAHRHGYRSFTLAGSGEHGRNSMIFGALSMGEGWHNNHHAYPGSARMGLTWWELDPGYWVILIMERFGLARDIKTPANLPIRANATPLAP